MSAKYAYINQSGWGQSKALDHEAYVFNRKTDNMLTNLKLHEPVKSTEWPENDGSLLLGAICAARAIAASRAAAAAVAPAKVVPAEVEEYVGHVKEVRGREVIAEIGPMDDIDGWDVILPRDSFKGNVHEQQEFKCTITRKGSHVDIDVKVLDSSRLRELKDFGIDKAERLEWASQIDVCLKPLYRSSSSADD